MIRPTPFQRIPLAILAAHIYVAMRLMASASGPTTRWVVLLAVVALYALILAGFLARRRAGEPRGDRLAWGGFLALGCFSWLFVLTLLRDLVLIALAIAAAAAPALEGVARHASAATALAVPVLTLIAVVLGLYNARHIPRVLDVDIPLAGLPAPLCGLTIVQVSDLHVGPTIKRHYVQAVVDVVNRLSPDIVALTGDLVDGGVARLSADVAPLATIQATIGVYAVTGNHEYYSGAQEWIAEFRRLGFDVLMNEHRVVRRGGATLVVAGVTDISAGHFDPDQASSPADALRGAPPDAQARLLLAHQPRSASDAARAGFDLQLSGHTHGGQFWPWRYVVPLQQPYVAGLHRLGELWIYVSRGTGYWGPPLRLGARSEITRLHLRRAAS